MHTKRSWLWAVMVASAVVLTAGCSDDENNDVPNPGEAEGEEELTLTDAQIARVLQVANEGEIQLGQLGQSLATDTAVRDFNARMVTEHTTAQQRLTALVQAQGIQPADSAISQQLQEEVRRLAVALQGRTVQGAALDLALMDTQLVAHARTAMLGDTLLSPQAQNQALVQELTSQRLEVQEHLREALTVQTDLFNSR